MANRYKIFFANGELATRGWSTDSPSILLYPIDTNWNDFNIKSKFGYSLIDESLISNEEFKGELNLGFVGTQINPHEIVLEHSSKTGMAIFPAEEIGGFYTLHKEMQSYRTVIARLGLERAILFLTEIGDLVVLGRQENPPKWLDIEIESDIFSLSFMRNSDSFFAFHNAWSLFTGLENESIDNGTKAFRLEFKLGTFTNGHELDFHFDKQGTIPKRISVIIGENGVGKSQSLYHFVQSLRKDDRSLRDDNGQRPKLNRVIAVASPGETRATFPTPKPTDKIRYTRIRLGRGSRTEHGLCGVILQLARSKESVKDFDRWTLFKNAVSEFLPLQEIFMEIKRTSFTDRSPERPMAEPFPITDLKAGGERISLWREQDIDKRADVWRMSGNDLVPLSSGQLTFLRLAANLCLEIENSSAILIDEPETHMHPKMITEFVHLLDNLLEMTGSIAIIATHSPYYVREVSRTQVTVLRRTDSNEIESINPRLQTLGADVGAISMFVFGDALYGRMLKSISGKLSVDRASAAGIVDRYERELAPEALMFLRRELESKEGI